MSNSLKFIWHQQICRFNFIKTNKEMKLNIQSIYITCALISGNLPLLVVGETSLVCYAVQLLFIFKHYNQIKGFLAFLILTMIISFLMIFIYGVIDLSKDIFFLISIIFGYLLCRVDTYNIYKITLCLRYILIFLVFVACLQSLVPSSALIFDVLFTRYSLPSNLRGASSIFQEPSFYSFFVGVCFMIMWISVSLQKITKIDFIILIISLLLSRSSMFIIIAPFLFYAVDFDNKLKLIFALFSAYALYVFSENINIFRFLYVLEIMLSGEKIIDASASSRLFYIVKDIKYMLSNYGLIIGFFGSYSSVMDSFYSFSVPNNFLYNPNLSGSLLGRYIVQFGLLIVVSLFFLIIVYTKKFGLSGLLFSIFFITLYLQMIPTSFVISGFGVGVIIFNFKRLLVSDVYIMAQGARA